MLLSEAIITKSKLNNNKQEKLMKTEIIDIDTTTGEILIDANTDELKLIKTTKIKAFQLLSKNDFVNINGTWEATRDGLIKILSSLPISYSWVIQDKVLDHDNWGRCLFNR